VADYLYRGVNLTYGTPSVLSDGVIEGESLLVIEGSALAPDKTVSRNTTLNELGGQVVWATRERYNTGVTGGVTHRLMGSARFGGGRRTRVILDANQLPFQRVYYEYDWMDDHPGVLPHILTTSAGELRVRFNGLWAIITKTKYGPEKWKSLPLDQQYKIEHWSADDLPATNPNSQFAEESEWVAMQDEVSVDGAIDSTVHILGEKRRSDTPPEERAFDVLNEVEREHPETQDYPHYVLVVKNRHKQTGGPYGLDEIVAAYGRTTGRADRPGGSAFPLDPEEVPHYVRGVQ